MVTITIHIENKDGVVYVDRHAERSEVVDVYESLSASIVLDAISDILDEIKGKK